MTVLHVIPSISPKHGGPSFALPAITRALALYGIDATIATTDDDGRGARFDVPLGRLLSNEQAKAQVIYFRKNTEFYKMSLGLRQWLKDHVSDFDVVHIHALFSYSSLAAAKAASRAGVPYIVRPLGVLNRWGIENRRRALKAVSLRLFELPALRRAAAIHYTSEVERNEAAEAAPEIAKLNSAVIPLPIELEQFSAGDAQRFRTRHGLAEGARVVLYLSRIDRKKAIELLLESFGRLSLELPDAVLVVAGDGEAEYLTSLKQKAAQLGITSKVIWPRFLSGDDKADAFSAATLFVLPSYSENFGIAAAEALAAGVPSILSSGVAVAVEAEASGAAVVVKPSVDALTPALRRVLESEELRGQLSNRAREFVTLNYSPRAIGAKLKELYDSVKVRKVRDAR